MSFGEVVVEDTGINRLEQAGPARAVWELFKRNPGIPVYLWITAAWMLVGRSTLSRFGLLIDERYSALLLLSLVLVALLPLVIWFSPLRSFRIESTDIWLVLLVAYMAAVPLWSIGDQSAQITTLAFAGFMLLSFLFARFLHEYLGVLAYLLGALTYFIVVVAFIQFAFYGITYFEEGRLAFLGGPNIFIRFCSFALLWDLVYIKRRYLRLLLAILPVMGLLLSGSRQAAVFLAVFLGITLTRYVIPTRVKGFDYVLKRVVPVLLIAVVSFWVIGFITIPARMLLIGESIELRTLSFGMGYTTSIFARLEGITPGLQLFATSPLFGTGPGSFAVYVNHVLDYPHNLFLELLSEYGLMGTLLALGLLFACGRELVRYRWYESKGVTYFTLIGLTTLLYAQFSGHIYDSRLVFLGLYVGAKVCEFRKPHHVIES